ncbi:hypothetical protein ANN_27059 [Periplaneta americana]|uniref:Reverse transcriptase zinc-binding domain-containing protein n=1 Tax=Periplaneta americana TaxID=6978 RepID=A0ABQ8RX76_PERAM|nr:hypothetical protein ANN_27059 [Periplaneta americana]
MFSRYFGGKWPATKKMIYQHILQDTYQTPHIMERYPKERWSKIWNNLHLADIPTTWKISAYEYINEIIPTEEKKYRHNITASSACKKCEFLDTQKHRVTNCGPAKFVWEEAKRRLCTIGDIKSVNGMNQVLLCIDPPTESNVFVHVWLAVSLLLYQLTTELPTVNYYIGMLKTEKIKVKYKYQSDARSKIHQLDLLQL